MTDHPENPTTPTEPTEPTKPGERLRRLLASTDETVPAEPGAGQPEAEQSTMAQLADDLLAAAEAEPPADLAEAPTQPLPHHPTGEPDLTGGWYQPGEPVTPPPPPAATLPHPVPPPAAVTRPVTPDPDALTFPPPPGLGDHALPFHVEETDLNATRVTPSAYAPPGARPQHPQPTGMGRPAVPAQPKPAQPKPAQPKPAANGPRKPGGARRALGCAARGLIGLLFLGVSIIVIMGAVAVIQYFVILQNLPSVENLRASASQFETTRILDRNNNVLYEIIDPNAGRRTYVTLDRVSPYLLAATIATEDKEYYNHPGFDPVAIARALWRNMLYGEGTGASTITQQLARMLLLPDERYERTLDRKAREIVLAAEITRLYSKEEILELYINELNYGNLSYGIEAAAESYFGVSASELTLGQAAFLTGIPQAPSVYDIFTNRDATLLRTSAVLDLTYTLSSEKGCIDVRPDAERVCISTEDYANAALGIINYPFQPSQYAARYPHWVDYIRAELEARYDPQTIYRSGFTVYTTLDPLLQEQAEALVRDQVAMLTANNATNGALIAIRPSTGEILAMVGSADYHNAAISGQVNMALAPRQPGSAMKPLTYAAAFEKGWTPATLIWDVPTGFPPSGDPNDPRDPYRPVNYDGRFHGPVSVRSALANSFNIPAVKALEYIGIYDNPATEWPDGLVPFAQRLGITTLTRNDYGLALTLGGGDVSLLEMTGAYAVFANGGQQVPPVAITRIVDHEGNVVYEYEPPEPVQALRSEHAYLISSILSDNAARTPMFGANSVLNLPFAAAAKTGTTNDYRDNWTIGYTPDLVTGVWVGNADYTPMQNTTGLTGAAPIWAQFMQFAVPQLTGGYPTPFTRPPGVVDLVVCSVSGAQPSQWCPEQRTEIFAANQPPAPADQDLWQKVLVDTWTGLRASPICAEYTSEEFAINVTDKSAIEWIRNTDEGRAWADSLGFEEPFFFTPERECTAEDERPLLFFSNLTEGQTITENPLDVWVVVSAVKDFKEFRLDYGLGSDPADWETLVEGLTTPLNQPGLVGTWDISSLPAGPITLRLHLDSDRDTYAEKIIHINVQVPTLTPTPTPTPTQTPTPTPTPTTTPTKPPDEP